VRAALVSAIGLLVAFAAGFAVRGLAASRPLSPAFLRSHSKCAGHELWKIKTLVDDQADVNKTAKTGAIIVCAAAGVPSFARVVDHHVKVAIALAECLRRWSRGRGSGGTRPGESWSGCC
jgi:hypothetical protein